jgi:hypothetical protein
MVKRQEETSQSALGTPSFLKYEGFEVQRGNRGKHGRGYFKGGRDLKNVQ